MAVIKRGQFAFRNPGIDEVPEGSVIESGNFSQSAPDTAIMVDRVLTINGGNWLNVRKDPAWTINGGMWLQKHHCTNLHPRLIEKGLTACVENCSHATAHEIVVDSVVIETVYTYEDEKVS